VNITDELSYIIDASLENNSLGVTIVLVTFCMRLNENNSAMIPT